MTDSDNPQEPGPDSDSGSGSGRDSGSDPFPARPVCHWCQGSGFVPRVLAHHPGPDPFRGPADTVHRTGQCKHCRGTGTYDSALDPTIGPEERTPPHEP
ncbi:hypothetical protein [Streptomyces luteireticuli]